MSSSSLPCPSSASSGGGPACQTAHATITTGRLAASMRAVRRVVIGLGKAGAGQRVAPPPPLGARRCRRCPPSHESTSCNSRPIRRSQASAGGNAQESNTSSSLAETSVGTRPWPQPPRDRSICLVPVRSVSSRLAPPLAAESRQHDGTGKSTASSCRLHQLQQRSPRPSRRRAPRARSLLRRMPGSRESPRRRSQSTNPAR